MQFKLKTLLTLTTIACVLLVICLSIVEHRRKVQEWRLAFQTLDQQVEELGPDLKAQLISLPETKPRSGAYCESTSCNKSYIGKKSKGSLQTQEFASEFDYHWQSPDGSRSDGVRFTVDSSMNLNPLDDHVVHLRYEAHSLNNQIVKWVDEELTSNPYVHVEHHQLKSPAPSIMFK